MRMTIERQHRPAEGENNDGDGSHHRFADRGNSLPPQDAAIGNPRNSSVFSRVAGVKKAMEGFFHRQENTAPIPHRPASPHRKEPTMYLPPHSMLPMRQGSAILALLLALGLDGTISLANEIVRGRPVSGVRTRDIVRGRLPEATESIALEYTIESLDRAGIRTTVDPTRHFFNVGDSFLMKVKPQDDVYVYIFTEGPTGDRTLLLPAPDAAGRHVLVPAGMEVVLPGDRSWFEFVPPAGEEKLVVVALKEPCKDLGKLQLASFERPPAAQEQIPPASKQSVLQQTTLDAVRSRQNLSIRLRGPVQKQVDLLSREFDRAKTFTVIEPPTPEEPGTYALSVANRRPEIILDIPLRSRTRLEE
jgi:hypothetical protein